MSRLVRTRIPITTNNLTPKAKVKNHYDRLAQRKSTEYSKGQAVIVQKGRVWEPATIMEKYETPHSYIIRDNRKHKSHIELLNCIRQWVETEIELMNVAKSLKILTLFCKCHEDHGVTRGSRSPDFKGFANGKRTG
ncbi:hypothetical protein PR048_013192 [Dryococelus australis]|uniref:Uncharacterized protein n=1 Tax=Dryococelus australis TaxID=614101 RepID=A0ABQ9HRG0_9NEOP|nr:hypothetical protein PR048_013192 [Dryococelus australis]